MAVDTRPSTLKAIHNYNLRNQGWPTRIGMSPNVQGDSDGAGPTKADPVTFTFAKIGVYPSNADNIHFYTLTSAIEASLVGAYSPFELEKFSPGNTPAAKGHFILNAFDRNRQTASNIDGIYDPERDKEDWRPIDVAFHAGRVWYLMQTGVLYFSQTLTEISNASKCYQEADPTAEDINDLVDTDGGVIDLAGIGKAQALIPLGNELAVLANNGIWSVSGLGEEGFTTTRQEISKITNVGAIGRDTVVEAEGTIFYWSSGGIYSLATDQVSAQLVAQNISENTIQTFYTDIPEIGRQNARGFYDERNKKIYWFYNDSVSQDGVNWRYQYDKVLVLDLTLQAFYTYSFSVAAGQPFVSAMMQKKAGTVDTSSGDVTDGGVTVTDGGVAVTATSTSPSTSEVELKLLTFYETTTDNFNYTFSEFKNTSMLDWPQISSGTNYTSFIETGHDLLEDVISEKEANTVYCFFKRTETALQDSGSGDLVFDLPSSCLLTAKWAWADATGSNQWIDVGQIYRLQRPIIQEAGSFDYGYEVIQTINQVRGKGRALALRFSSEQGKDFHLLGWSIPYTVITGA